MFYFGIFMVFVRLLHEFLGNLAATANDIDTVFGVCNSYTLKVVVNGGSIFVVCNDFVNTCGCTNRISIPCAESFCINIFTIFVIRNVELNITNKNGKFTNTCTGNFVLGTNISFKGLTFFFDVCYVDIPLIN